jgi:hypothetical protein
MPDLVPGAPPAVAAALERLRDDLTRVAGGNLAGLLLYGGLARGRYRPGRSDVNVVLVLNDVSAAALAAVGPALAAARRAAGVEPMILTPAEVRAAALDFPTKFLDIKDHHLVLAGADPFAGLDVPRDAVRRGVARELRNLALRLRRRYLVVYDDADAQAGVLARVARPLAIGAAALLRLAGKPAPADDRSAAVFDAASSAFDLDRDALARLAALRQGGEEAADVPALYQKVLSVVARLADAADQVP